MYCEWFQLEFILKLSFEVEFPAPKNTSFSALNFTKLEPSPDFSAFLRKCATVKEKMSITKKKKTSLVANKKHKGPLTS